MKRKLNQRMLRRWVGVAVMVGLIGFGLSRCGSSTPSVSAGQSGTFDVEIGDVPLCNILSFRGLVTGLTMKSAVATGNGTSVLAANSAIYVDFASLQNTSTILAETTLATGTYVGGTITVNAPTMTVYDPSTSPPLSTITPTLSQESNIPFTINPPMVVTANKVSVLRLDFNIPQSVETAGGQINITGATGSATVKVKPVFTAHPLTASLDGSFGNMDDVSGYITSVSNTSQNANFIGSFSLQTLSGSTSTATGPAVTVELTNNSQLIGASALNQITTDDYTEVNGYLDTDGDFVANTIVVEDQSDLTNQFSTFIGSILSVQKDSTGNVTQLQMSVRDEEPNTGNGTGNPVQLDSPPAIVNISPSTGFHFSSPSTNFPNLVPDATYLAVGQQVAVEGTYTPPPSTSSSSSSITAPSTAQPSVAAQDVYVPLQSLMGNFTSLAAAGADNLSGGFVLTPCSTLFSGVPIYVITDAQTNFVNVQGLSALTPTPSLVVRGLLFFDQQGGTIENAQIPPGSLVMLASEVNQE